MNPITLKNAVHTHLVYSYLDLLPVRRYTEKESTPPGAVPPMKVYDTNYPPDTFGRIRMGLIKEMYLTHTGFSKSVGGAHLRLSCTYQGVIRDVITLKIISAVVSNYPADTLLIKVEGMLSDMAKIAGYKNDWFYQRYTPSLRN